MDYLIDSHVYLWAAMSPEKLNKSTIEILEDNSNRVFVSVISYWELSLKFGLGKLDLKNISPSDFTEVTAEMGFQDLEVTSRCATFFHELPREDHKDPFDRMLIWQSINHKLTLISRDQAFSDYCKYGLNLHYAG